MTDIVLVTADSVRYDYADEFDLFSTAAPHTGIAASHYTRPSLASLLSSSYEAALTTEVRPPTLPMVLSEAGYTCFGFSPTPNTDARFGFDAGFDTYETFVDPGTEGSTLRAYLSKSDLVRRIYYKFKSPHAKSDARPDDRTVVDRAIRHFNDAEPPRFLWVHLMESHRPYGTGDDALSKRLDQKAFFDPGKLTAAERSTIERTYRDALGRVNDTVEYLVSSLETDSTHVLFTSDHGEAFGEPGFFFHQGHKRCVADVQTKVPVFVDGFEANGPLSLIDVAPTLLDSVDLSPPDSWHGNSRLEQAATTALTIAPWHNTATVAWRNFETTIVARDADVSLETDETTVSAERTDVDGDLLQQLRDLGYLDAG